MGAEFNYRTFADNLGESAIRARWDSMCEQSQHDSGHSYSGAIGMLDGDPYWSDKMFATEDAAQEFVADTHQKWRPAVAVSFSKNGEKFWMIGGWCSS